MAKKKKKPASQGIEGVESALTKTERFIEENQKMLTYIVLGIVVIIAGYLGYHRFILGPTEVEAQSQMFVAEQYFEKDSFNLALYGDGNYFGFLDIIDEYGITKSKNLAFYYAGISFLNLGDYESAIDYLKKFDSDDKMVGPIASGAMGDAYFELGETDEALSYYLKAGSVDNEFIAPVYLMKAGLILDDIGNYREALDVYERIEKEYPETSEGREIEKYITRVNLKLE